MDRVQKMRKHGSEVFHPPGEVLRNRGLAEPGQIGTQDAVFLRHSWHPPPPREAGFADPVDEKHRLRLPPRLTVPVVPPEQSYAWADLDGRRRRGRPPLLRRDSLSAELRQRGRAERRRCSSAQMQQSAT